MHPLFFASSNIIFSVLLGAIAMVAFAFGFPNAFSTMLDAAGSVKNWMTNLGIPPYYNNIIRLILHESTILFSFFTIGARVIFALLVGLGRWISASLGREQPGNVVCPKCGHPFEVMFIGNGSRR